MAAGERIVVCGAGIAGVATAHELATRHACRDVTLVDAGAPLSLTSDKSTEAYRNFWPGPDGAMVRLMNRSVDRLEEVARSSGNRIRMNRRGYVFATAEPARVEAWRAPAAQASAYGAGPLREHHDAGAYEASPAEDPHAGPAGADLLAGPGAVRTAFPALGPETIAVLHVRRAGWLSAQQLGMQLLEEAIAAGVRLVRDRVAGVETRGNRVRGVRLASGQILGAGVFVDAAGPFAPAVAQLLDVEIPVFNELHSKAAFADRLGAVPRESPLLIWSDAQELQWSDDEREVLEADPGAERLLRPLPAGAHLRPEGAGDAVLLLWEYDTPVCEPVFPVALDPRYGEVALRGMTRLVPALAAYLERLPRLFVDGGYYTKTRENRPLACALTVEGAYLIGAMSGFGIMSALGLAEIVASRIVSSPLPDYAPAFDLARYADPAYRRLLECWGDSWQL